MSGTWYAGLNPPVGGVDSALGIFMARFGSMELYISVILGHALGDAPNDPKMGYAITGHIQSISTKIDVAKSCLAVSSLDQQIKDALSAALDRIRAVNTVRNQFAHGQWEFNDQTRDVRIKTNLFSAGRNVQTKDKILQSINEQTIEMNRITTDVGRLLGL